MKVLAMRFHGAIKNLVGPPETSGIRGRSICTNIHIARSSLETWDMDFRKVAMFQVDFEKAFDKVWHDDLFKILGHVRMGKTIVDGVKMA